MKVVIDIDEEMYKYICKHYKGEDTACLAIKDGLVLSDNILYPLERTKGKWIRKVDEVGFVSHICSKCGAEIEVEDCSDDKFCFNYGAEMGGVK